MMLTLMVPDAPAKGFTVTGTGFAPDSWIWITVEDITDGTQPINGPDAFQPNPDGTFTRTGTTALTCGHTLQANAFVQDKIVATSTSVTPKCLPAPPPASDTADTNATAVVKAAYADLATATTREARRLVIGQALRGWDNDLPVDQPVTALTKSGLPAPKLVEVDLTDFDSTLPAGQGDSPRVTAMYKYLSSHVGNGGLIGFSFHVDNPFTGGNAWDRAGVDGNLSQLADPNNPQNLAAIHWQGQLNRIADVMHHFDEAVVLFRPLHESNGAWFWWGQRDPAGFRGLWQGMFRYLTTTKGLHNLLWVYSANRNFGGAAVDPTRNYPGGDYVDLVGLDIYDDNLSDASPGSPGYAAMVGLGKPFGITEYAAVNFPTAHDGAKELPNDEVIKTIKQVYPQTVLATAWYSQNGNNWQISDKPNPEALLRDPWAITL
jgi:hypothetical protein